jgi:hypothetical protein
MEQACKPVNEQGVEWHLANVLVGNCEVIEGGIGLPAMGCKQGVMMVVRKRKMRHARVTRDSQGLSQIVHHTVYA